MKLSVVIVNYNVRHYITQCLYSVRRAIEGMDADVYVVDNHSQDDSVEYIRRHFPDVHLIESNHNLGFAKANNIAIRRSTAEYVLMLNPDTIVGENTFRDAVRFMDEHPQSGAIGVRMLKCDGGDAMESRRGRPTPMTAFYKMCGLCAKFPMSHRFGKYYMSYLPWDTPQKIEVISGAFCMMRKKALDITGLVDEDFFMYGEDIDLSCRILDAGFENWYVPTKILHYKGESTKKSSFRYVHVFYEAMLIYFRKHYGHISFFISIPIKLAIFVKAFIALIEMQIDLVRKSLGFVSKGSSEVPEYVFIGSKEMLDKCRRLASEKGLTSQFFEGNAGTLPHGHQQLDGIANGRRKNIVYDTASYTYEQILEIFSEKPDPRMSIGLYHGETNTIVTQYEIYE